MDEEEVAKITAFTAQKKSQNGWSILIDIERAEAFEVFDFDTVEEVLAFLETNLD